MPVIGLVGGIGAGKSIVAAALERRGAFVIDADAVGHALLNQRPVREEVVARFGPRIVVTGDDGVPLIDRRNLGALAFQDPKARKDLESILHPRMRKTFAKAIARTIRRGAASAVVLDAAILYEAGWDSLCDQVVFVDAPRQQRLARVVAGRGWSGEILEARERAQGPLEEKQARADVVVANTGDLDALEAEVTRAWEAVRRAKPSRYPPRNRTGGTSTLSGAPDRRGQR